MSEAISPLNIFAKGSNLDPAIFEFDIEKFQMNTSNMDLIKLM